jgi:hypothetical protein
MPTSSCSTRSSIHAACVPHAAASWASSAPIAPFTLASNCGTKAWISFAISRPRCHPICRGVPPTTTTGIVAPPLDTLAR